MKNIRKKFAVNATKLLIDLTFCTAAYFILLNIFTNSSDVQLIDHIYTSIFMSTLIMASSVNSWFITPKYLNKKNFALWFFFFAINILAFTIFNQMLFDKFIDYILPNYYFISYYDVLDILKFFFVFVSLISLIHISYDWLQWQGTKHNVLVLEKEKANAELKALTNQINPHFLFNNLTVLYGLALSKSDSTADAIIKLSDILRYVIYESGKGKVSLGSEIKLIEDYIDLQKYRIEKSTRITFNHNVANKTKLIEPMLLLPLIENSFKHGAKGDTENTFIDISLYSNGYEVAFDISNNKLQIPVQHESNSGIGLKNIEERLKRIYRDNYKMVIHDKADVFHVNLKLNLIE